MAEIRTRAERIKLRKPGRIHVGDSEFMCIILDASTTGALLLVHDVRVPESFRLTRPSTGDAWTVRVVRRHPQSVAVVYAD